jgi:hypothetical protein
MAKVYDFCYSGKQNFLLSRIAKQFAPFAFQDSKTILGTILNFCYPLGTHFKVHQMQQS